MRALVTGGDGFVGRWLCAHLESAGDEVVALTGADIDIRDAPAVLEAVTKVQPDALYHLAALANVAESWTDPSRVFAVNATGVLHVLEAARACTRPPRVLLVSSAEVYGAVRPEALPLREDAPLRPVTPYAASKVAAEYLGVQYHLGFDVPVLVARPFNHVGPGQAGSFVVIDLARRIVDAERVGSASLAVGNLSPRRDFTDVRDVVRAYRLLVERGEPGQVYNVCSGRDTSIEHLAHRLLGVAGVELSLAPDPDLIRPVDVPILRGDPTRLVTATGWQPEFDLDRTLADVVAEARAELPA